jgi:hypothetical protein
MNDREVLDRVYALKPIDEAIAEGQNFGDVVSMLPLLERAFAIGARLRFEREFRDKAPDWLSGVEKERAEELMEWMLTKFPGSSPEELLWTLAADAFRPPKRGRQAKWAGVAGRELLELVELGLSATGLKRDGRKGLRIVIAQIRARCPERYGVYSEDRLRLAYYEARRAQLGKAAN